MNRCGPFAAMAGMTPIHEYRFSRPPIEVTYSLEFELERARLDYGLTKSEYDVLPGTRAWMTETDTLCKCDVLAVFRINQLIPLVFADAAARRAKMGL